MTGYKENADALDIPRYTNSNVPCATMGRYELLIFIIPLFVLLGLLVSIILPVVESRSPRGA